MACTDTGLKMCILPAVLTLKPLREKGKKSQTAPSLLSGCCKLALGAPTIKRNKG